MRRTLQVLAMLLLAAGTARAGIFSRTPSEEELAKMRLAEENCLAENSKALCTLLAARTPFDLKDVEVPADQWKQFGLAERNAAAMGDVAGIAAGLSQVAGSAASPLPLKGLGTVNLLGSVLMMGAGSQRTSDSDRLVAFVPESQAADAEAAAHIMEDAFVAAFVKTVPGVTAASYETIRLDKENRAGTYVLHGGDCDRTQCVLWSYLWGRICREEQCKRPAVKMKLVEHGYLGQALMLDVSRNLPPWASYYFGPVPRRKVPYPCC